MKRDWDLIRKQLTDIEEERDALADIPAEPKWEDQPWDEYERQANDVKATEERIVGHLELLIESGYIDGLTIQRGADNHISIGVSHPRLTMRGHDLLQTMRSPTLWESIKSNAKKKGVELTFEVIKTFATAALKQLS